MPRIVRGLSAGFVSAQSSPGRYADGNGLYLQVAERGRSWLFRYMRDGRSHEMGLGSVSTVSISLARRRANQQRRLLLAGKDPLHERWKSTGIGRGPTFQEAAGAYIRAKQDGWRSAKHRAQWSSTLTTYVFPTIGSVPVEQITQQQVLDILEPIWISKHETARRVRGRIEAVLTWATANGYRRQANPARWRDGLEHKLAEPIDVRSAQVHPALPFGELPDFMAGLASVPGTAARALEFTILTAACTREVLGASWNNVDMQVALWTIPGDRSNSSRDHRIPLSRAAMRVLGSVRDSSAWLFEGHRADRPLSNIAMLRILRRVESQRITVHGFRATFRTWCWECASCSQPLVDAAMGRKAQNSSCYDPSVEQRRALMEQWAQFAMSGRGANEFRGKVGRASDAGPSGRRAKPIRAPRHDTDAELTARERDVLTLLAKGLTIGACAQMLNISANTVAGYTKNLYRKLNVNSRAEATLEATRRGFVTF